MFAVRAMLCAIEKWADSATEDDFTGIYGKMIDKPPEELQAQTKKVVKTTAAAAGLVFLHSAFENAVFDLLRRLLIYDPEGWVKQIEDKKVSFTDSRSMDAFQLRDKLLNEWLEKIEKESFPKKVDLVLGFLNPDTTRGVIEGFDFNREEFRKIDQLRHDMTHRPNFAEPIDDVYGKLRYLHCTVQMLEKMAEDKFPGAVS